MRRRELMDWLAVSTARTATAAAGGCDHASGIRLGKDVAPLRGYAEASDPLLEERTIDLIGRSRSAGVMAR